MKERALFDGLMRGPEVLHQVRENLATLPKGASVEKMVQQTLIDNDYTPSAKQLDIMQRSFPFVQEHRDALQRVSTLFQERPERMRTEMKEDTARALEGSPDNMYDFTLHATSVTATVAESVLVDEGIKINENFGAKVFDPDDCAGLTQASYLLKIKNKQLPFSLLNKRYANENNRHVADHEDLHVQYRYLHPEASGESDENESQKPYLAWLQNYTKELVESNNKEAFSQLIKKITSNELELYLNELSSEALTNNHDVYNDIFSGGGYLYSDKLGLKLRTLKGAVLQYAQTDLSWIRVIREEVQRTKHKAAYIDKAYRQLVKQETPYLVEIAEMLTPEQGYVISAFVDGDPTLAKMKQWKREYEQVPEEELSSEGLLFEAIGLDPIVVAEEGYDMSRYNSDITQTIYEFLQKKKAFLKESENPAFASDFYLLLFPLLQVQKERIHPLLTFLKRRQAMPENAFGLTKKQVTHIVTKAIDLDTIFFTTWDYSLHNATQELLIDPEFQKDMIKVFGLSLSMDSIAEDISAALLNGDERDIEQVVTPLYERPPEKKQQIFDLLHGDATDTTGLSPQEQDALTLYHLIIDNEIDEIPGNIVDLEKSKAAYFRNMRRLLSMCYRSIVYAQEAGISLPVFDKPAGIINNFASYGLLPDSYMVVTRTRSEEQAEENVQV